MISARPLAGELVEGTRTAPEHTTAVVAARAPTTDVERLESEGDLAIARRIVPTVLCVAWVSWLFLAGAHVATRVLYICNLHVRTESL